MNLVESQASCVDECNLSFFSHQNARLFLCKHIFYVLLRAFGEYANLRSRATQVRSRSAQRVKCLGTNSKSLVYDISRHFWRLLRCCYPSGRSIYKNVSEKLCIPRLELLHKRLINMVTCMECHSNTIIQL